MRGPAFMVLAAFCFALMGVCIKKVGHDVSALTLAFYRSTLSLILLSTWLLVRRHDLRTPYWRTHLYRGGFGVLALLASFVALSRLPLALAVTLNYSSPFFLLILYGLMLRRWPSSAVLAVVLGLLGVLLVLHPQGQAVSGLGVLCGLAAGMLAALAFWQVRQLGTVAEPAWRVVFYFSAIASLVTTALQWTQPWAWPPSSCWPWLWGMAALATVAQIFMTLAYQHGPTLAVGTALYSNVIFSAALGWGLLGEHVGAWAALGVVCIVLAGLISVKMRASSVPVRSA